MNIRFIFRAVAAIAILAAAIHPAESQTLDHRRLAAQVVRDELHQQLEKIVGSDVSVETYIQALDHLAHGEFEAARAVALEQGVAELLGAALGSTGASLIGAAWSFDKWVWSSCQEWGKSKDRKAFLAGFLEPKIRQWMRDRKIPDWRSVRGDPTSPTAVPGSLEAWFDDYRMTLRRIALFADREAEIDRLKQEMWEHTRWIMGKLHQQFERERRLQEAARRAEEELDRRVEEKTAMAREAERALRAAGLQPDERTLKRYLTDAAYRRDILARARPGPARPGGVSPGERPQAEDAGAGSRFFGLWIVERRRLESGHRTEQEWVVYREGSQEIIRNVKASYQCIGELRGSTLSCRWDHDIGEFTTVLRFAPDGSSFTGETNFLYYATRSREREVLKGRRPPSDESPPQESASAPEPSGATLLANGDFSDGTRGWQTSRRGYGGALGGVSATGPDVIDGRLVIGASAGTHNVWQKVPVNGLGLRLRAAFRVRRWSTFGGRNGGWTAVHVSFIGRDGASLGTAYYYLNPVAPSMSRPGVLWEQLGPAEPAPTGWHQVDVDLRRVAVDRLGIAESDVAAVRVGAVVFGTHEDRTFTVAEFDQFTLEPTGAGTAHAGETSLPIADAGDGLLFADDFERAGLGSFWTVASGSWRIVNGKLEAHGANGLLWLDQPLPRDIAVEVDVSGPYDLNVGIAGDGHAALGYTFDFGGWLNTRTALVAGHQIVAESADWTIEHPERTYRLRIERRGPVIHCWIDGRPVFTYSGARSSDPSGFDRLYFQNWASPIRFDNLRVYLTSR